MNGSTGEQDAPTDVLDPTGFKAMMAARQAATEAGIQARIEAAKARKEAERDAKRRKRWAQEAAAEEAAAALEATKAAEEQRKQRMASITARLRRTQVWCSCEQVFHKECCRIIGAHGEVRWLGPDMNFSREELERYHANGGRIGTKGVPLCADGWQCDAVVLGVRSQVWPRGVAAGAARRGP